MSGAVVVTVLPYTRVCRVENSMTPSVLLFYCADVQTASRTQYVPILYVACSFFCYGKGSTSVRVIQYQPIEHTEPGTILRSQWSPFLLRHSDLRDSVNWKT